MFRIPDNKKNIPVKNSSKTTERKNREPASQKPSVHINKALNTLNDAAKKLESRMKQAEFSSEKDGEPVVAKRNITINDLSEAMERQKREPDKTPEQILREMGLIQANSYMNISRALTSLNAVTKKLESKIQEAESSSNKIGQILVSKGIISESDLKLAMDRKKREPAKYLGQILCEMGLPQSKIMKGLYYSNKRKKLGEIFIELDIITREQLSDILDQQKQQKYFGIHKNLGTLLARSKMISEKDYVHALSAHFSMPIVSLKGYTVSRTLQKAIGEQYGLKNRIVVLNNSARKLTVALADPHLPIFEYLEKAISKEKHIIFCIAKSSEIEKCLDTVYDYYRYVRY
ncbi:MAG: hypothetical protein PHN98_04670 [Smithellaceae bacterium]|nr:hypothetical protein [Smithellaceae bacterium]